MDFAFIKLLWVFYVGVFWPLGGGGLNPGFVRPKVYTTLEALFTKKKTQL